MTDSAVANEAQGNARPQNDSQGMAYLSRCRGAW
jgi:hypothetical protein